MDLYRVHFCHPIHSSCGGFRHSLPTVFVVLLAVLTWGTQVVAQVVAQVESTRLSPESSSKPPAVASKLPPLGKEWVRIGQGKNKVWINQKKKQVAVDGEVCLTKGYLEMFACILGTKEHESVVALHSKAFVMHTALLAVGAEPGKPAQWRPRYQPASGSKIRLEVEWAGADKKVKRERAQQWVRDLKTKQPMAHDWVFAGSLFWVEPETKKKFYRAEGGEVVCVSNFPVAMLDLPIESSQVNEELAFEALTENIPPRRTPVRLYFIPEPEPEPEKDASSE